MITSRNECSFFYLKTEETATVKNFTEFAGKLLHRSLIFGPATVFKKTPAQMFSSTFCGILQNTFLTEHLQTTAFETVAMQNKDLKKMAGIWNWNMNRKCSRFQQNNKSLTFCDVRACFFLHKNSKLTNSMKIFPFQSPSLTTF